MKNNEAPHELNLAWAFLILPLVALMELVLAVVVKALVQVL